MSKVEEVLYKALEKGIYNETMSLAKDIKNEAPKMEVQDRYELAYERAKRSLLNSSPPLNP
jgi:hypothetical protein